MNVLLWARMSWGVFASGSPGAGCLPRARVNWQITNCAESDGTMASSPGQALNDQPGCPPLPVEAGTWKQAEARLAPKLNICYQVPDRDKVCRSRRQDVAHEAAAQVSAGP